MIDSSQPLSTPSFMIMIVVEKKRGKEEDDQNALFEPMKGYISNLFKFELWLKTLIHQYDMIQGTLFVMISDEYIILC